MNSEGRIAADFLTDSRAIVLVLFWYQWSRVQWLMVVQLAVQRVIFNFYLWVSRKNYCLVFCDINVNPQKFYLWQ
jgi:hypothetical protein